MLVIALPLMAIVGLLIALTSKGGVLFRQERIGKAGTPFRCFKFRTMISDAEKQLEGDLLRQWKRHHKLRVDPRVTPLGSLLRRASLDELPQLWNVIRGEMSLVGPRPFLPQEVNQRSSTFEAILSVSPGLTGLAQIRGRSALSFAQRIRYDSDYAQHRTLFLDLKLLLITIPTVLSGKGAW